MRRNRKKWPPRKDGDVLVAWLREAANELEKAHAVLDFLKVPRSLKPGSDVECTLAARIALLDEGVKNAE